MSVAAALVAAILVAAAAWAAAEPIVPAGHGWRCDRCGCYFRSASGLRGVGYRHCGRPVTPSRIPRGGG